MRPRWLIVGLVVSVALNLFLVGAGAGIVALGLSIAQQSAGGRPGVFFWATNGLPQPSRHKVRSWLASEREQIRPDVERSFAVRVQAWDGLAAAKPDPAAIKQGLAQGRQLDLTVRSKVEDGVVDQVAALPPAERTAFAAGMHKALMSQAPPASR
jgi:uncharacterized membrane protein